MSEEEELREELQMRAKLQGEWSHLEQTIAIATLAILNAIERIESAVLRK